MGLMPLIPPIYGYTSKIRSTTAASPSTTSVTYGADTMGSWTDIDGSAISGEEAHWIELHGAAHSSSGQDRRCLADVGLYDGSTTYLAIENIDVGSNGVSTPQSGSVCSPFMFPLWVPDGWRVRIRGQRYSVGGSFAWGTTLSTVEGWRGPLSKRWQVYETLGADTANSKGTVLTPSATADTMGTAVSLGTLTRDAIGFFCGFGLNGNTAHSGSGIYRFAITDGTTTLVDPAGIAWASSSEALFVVPSYYGGRHFRLFRTPVPAGTTLYGQVQCSAASAPALTMTIHCLAI